MLHITYHQTVEMRAGVEMQIQHVEHWNTCYISTNSFNVFQVMLHITYHQTVEMTVRVEIQIQHVDHWNTSYIFTTAHNLH